MKINLNISKDSFWKSVIMLSSGQLIAQVINVISIPVISRIYSKEAFGDFALLTSISTIIIGIVGLGLNSVIMLAENDDDAKRVFTISLNIQIILSTLIIVVLMILKDYIVIFNSSINYFYSLVIIYLYLVLNILINLILVYINRAKNDKILFFNSLRSGLSNILITIPLGIMGFDKYGMFVSLFISLFYLNFKLLKFINPYIINLNLNDYKKVLLKYRNFIKFQYPSNLITIVSNQIPIQFISHFFNIIQIADYSMVNRVFLLPFTLFATPIQTVHFRTIAENSHNHENISKLTYELIIKILSLSFIPVILVILFGKNLFIMFLGEKWAVAGSLSSILIVQSLFNFAFNCITYTRVVIGMQKANLIISILNIISVIISFILGTLITNSFYEVIFIYSIIMTSFWIFNIWITFKCLNRNHNKFLFIAVVYLVACALISNLFKLFII